MTAVVPGCRRAFVTRPGGQAGGPQAAGLMLPAPALPQVSEPYSSFAVSFLSLNLDLFIPHPTPNQLPWQTKLVSPPIRKAGRFRHLEAAMQ